MNWNQLLSEQRIVPCDVHRRPAAAFLLSEGGRETADLREAVAHRGFSVVMETETAEDRESIRILPNRAERERAWLYQTEPILRTMRM